MKTGIIWIVFVISILLLACDKQGPMGPEGAQGPDGPPGENGAGTGTGATSNVISFTGDQSIEWKTIDGAGNGYVLWGINSADDYLALPDSLSEPIEFGMKLVYLRSVENDWYQLPLEIGGPLEPTHEIYDYTFSGNKLHVYVKTRFPANDDSEPSYKLNTLKVIIGLATKTGELKFTD